MGLTSELEGHFRYARGQEGILLPRAWAKAAGHSVQHLKVLAAHERNVNVLI